MKRLFTCVFKSNHHHFFAITALLMALSNVQSLDAQSNSPTIQGAIPNDETPEDRPVQLFLNEDAGTAHLLNAGQATYMVATQIRTGLNTSTIFSWSDLYHRLPCRGHYGYQGHHGHACTTSILCSNPNTGAISRNVPGSINPYAFLWDDRCATPDRSGVPVFSEESFALANVISFATSTTSKIQLI